jgi:hypothetical protein
MGSLFVQEKPIYFEQQQRDALNIQLVERFFGIYSLTF